MRPIFNTAFFSRLAVHPPKDSRLSLRALSSRSETREGFVVALAALFLTAIQTRAEENPNILFILADDLGWADLGCYGHDLFQTPHLDKLASKGLRFTQAYSPAPICSASRAAILTGNSTARNRFEFVVKDETGFQPMLAPLRAPEYTVNLALNTTTIPEALAATGRPTAFFGKWHLNAHYGRYLGWSPTHGPLAQGFATATEDFGNHPYSYWKEKKLRNFDESIRDGEFSSDGVTQHAIDFILEEHNEPFFLMLSHFYVHDPNHTRLRWLHNHYLEQLPAGTQNREKVAHYGAMVTTLDHHVGQVLDALRESGREDNTLVVFTSDNGGHPNYAGNAPLRGSKWNLYEGGIRVPFIVRWPEVVAEGVTSDAPVWSVDLFPTFAEITGAESATAHDGQSLVPLLRDPEFKATPREMVWHFPYYHPEATYDKAPDGIGINDGFTTRTKPQSAIREGDWKLIRFYENDREELYHIPTDLAESENLAESKGKIRARLSDRLTGYLNEVEARFAAPNPDYAP